MKPIEAKFTDGEYTANGIVTDVVIIGSSFSQGFKGESVVRSEGAYAIFWEETDDDYKMSLLDVHDVRTSKRTMRNYIAECLK